MVRFSSDLYHTEIRSSASYMKPYRDNTGPLTASRERRMCRLGSA